MSYLFKNIFVINLDKDTDRLDKFYKNAEKVGISKNSIRRQPAIYGKELPKEVLNNYLAGLKTAGAVGCALSHIETWKTIIRENIDHALILEDDVTFTNFVKNIIDNKVDIKIPDDWDIIYMGHSKSKWPRNPCSRIPTPAYNYNEDNGIPYVKKINKNVIKFLHPKEFPMGCYAYCITYHTAKWLLENYKITEVVDVFFSQPEKLIIYGIIPVPITHCFGFGSNISPSIPRRKNIIEKSKEEIRYIKTGTNFPNWFIVLLICAIVISVLLGPKRIVHISIIFSIIIISFFIFDNIYSKKQQRTANYIHSISKYDQVPGKFGKDYFDPYGNVWTRGYKEKMRMLLQKFVDICDSLSPPVPVIIMFGSLLGWARHNKQIIPWDDDMDIVVFRKDFNRVLEAIKNEKDIDYTLNRPWIYDAKIWFTSPSMSEPIYGYKQRWPFLDIFVVEESGKMQRGNFIHKQIIPYPIEIFQDKFEGVKVYVPKRYKETLENLYSSNWEKMCVSSSWCHRTEYGIDKRYRVKEECSLIFPTI